MATTERAELAWRRPDLETVLVSALAGVAGVAGSFAVAGYTPAFVAGPIAGTLARRLPAGLITFSIVVLGDLGDQLNVLLALGLAVVLLGLAALAGWAVGDRFGSPAVGWAGSLVLAGLATFAVTGAVVPSAVAGLAVALVAAVASVGGPAVPAEGLSPERRAVLVGAAGALAFALGGYALGSRRSDVTPTASTSSSPASSGLGLSESVRADVQDRLTEASQQSLDVSGLEPLVSTTFYQVDIDPTDPTVDPTSWQLTVTGSVDRELTYSYADLLAMTPTNRFSSLRCVGESLNGHKLDNALWTGVPIMDLVEPAGVKPGCCVMFRAHDGFFEEFPLAALSDGFLAYGMNGHPLPRGHGFPVRALIPGHWGEINVKWITEIEVLETEAEGYWERRGWHGTGPVNTVAKLHVVNHLPDGRVEVAGHAYAGTRGVRTVQVSTDGGSAWHEAELSDPLPDDDVWRQWVYRYDPPAGSHEVVVRAVDGTGAVQPREDASPYPNGPSGWVSQTVRP